jgi:hypothetical protein
MSNPNMNTELKLNSDIIMENIAAWDETPEGKAFREANDIRKPSKPADAHAAGAHTPMTGDTERLLQIGQLTAERDRLKWEVDGYRKVATQLQSERDQAREQVKTLLEFVRDIEAWLTAPLLSTETVTHFQSKARAAIASVESEEQ